jgi:hypothetical protein
MITAIGCGSPGGATPSEAAQEFLKALIVRDESMTIGLLSEEFKRDHGITAITWKLVMMRNPIPRDATFSTKSEFIEDGTATVNILTGRGEEGQVKLVREGDRWMVGYELGQWYGLAPDME